MQSGSTNQKLAISAGMILLLWASHAVASDVKIVRYSKEDLQRSKSEQDFIKPSTLREIVTAKFKDIAITMTQRQSGSNTTLRDLASSTRELSKLEWTRKMASLTFDPDKTRTEISENIMRQTLLSQSRRAVEVSLKRDFPVVERFKNGMTFNLTLSENKVAYRPKEIKYGLIEQDIIPSSQSIPLAAYSNIDSLYRTYATPAKVIYTIDRVERRQVRTVFEDENEGNFKQQAFNKQQTFSWSRLPRANAVVKIDGGGQEGFVSEQFSSAASPSLRVKATQVDGLISSQIMIGKASMEKTLLTEMTLPLPAGFQLTQKLDYRFKSTEVVAKGSIEDFMHSQVNIGYSPSSQHLKGEWLFTQDLINYGVTAESTRNSDKRFSFALNKNF